MVALLVLGENDEVVAVVALAEVFGEVLHGHIHLAAEYRFELFPVRLLGVHLIHVIEKLLDTEHVAVVGKGDAGHTVFNGAIHEAGNGSLAVEQAVL